MPHVLTSDDNCTESKPLLMNNKIEIFSVIVRDAYRPQFNFLIKFYLFKFIIM